MKLLLDESLPKRLKQDLSSYYVKTVQEMNWSGMSNGELLSIASNNFDVFISADQNLQYQQTLTNYNIAVLILAGKSSRYNDLKQLIPLLSRRLDNMEAGKVEIISE